MEMDGPHIMWSRRIAIASSPPIELWPTVSLGALEGNQETFLASELAMKLYFQNASISVANIERRTGISQKEYARMARRCLSIAWDGQIFGFRALIPYVRLRPNQRQAPFGPKRRHQQGGQAGALQALFRRFDNLEDELVMWIVQDAKLQRMSEYKLQPKDLHRIFLEYLRKKGVTEGEWPFNTQYRGVRTVQTYMRLVLNNNFGRAVSTRGGSPAKAHGNLSRGIPAFLNFQDPYDGVEIDSYCIDSLLTVAFLTPEGTETDVLLERLWLVAAVERASTAILAYTVAYRSEVSSTEILRVIRDAVTKIWSPRKLTPPLEYPPEGGLPSGVIPECSGACWNMTFFDGALAHLSQAVHDRVRRELGFMITWGGVAKFERRPNVERTFGKIARDVFKRLPSTTGSNPNNGRAENAATKAVRHKIRARTAEEMLDVYISQHNATPCEGISFLSPLEHIKYFVESENFFLRYLPQSHRREAFMFAQRVTKTVRGDMTDGRRPYIQLDRAKYSSPILAELGNLMGTDIIIEINEDDYRYVKAFLANGAEIGFLTAQGRWGITKHSVRTRRTINSLIAKRILVISEHQDPVRAFLDSLSTSKGTANTISPRGATDATRVSDESGLPLAIVPKKEEAHGYQRNDNISTKIPKRSVIEIDAVPVSRVRNRR